MAVKLLKPINYRKIPSILDYNFEKSLLHLGVKDKFCIAASGGPDSLSLIILANKFAQRNKLGMSVLTVDHGLRKESSEEAIWLGKVLKKMKIKHFVLKWNGKKPTSNIMDAARSKRYDLMLDKCHKLKVNYLLTAHHLDDQIENFFMRLVRGSGLKGLASISKSSRMKRIKIIRPFLDYQKKSLIKILAKTNQKYIDDASNKDSKYDRIRFRKLIGGFIDEGLDKNRLEKVISNLNQVDKAINYSTKFSIIKTISQNKYGHILIKKSIFLSLPSEIQYRILLFILKINSPQKKRIRSDSILKLIDIFYSMDFKKSTLNKSLFINQSSYILVVREIGRIFKDPIKNKNFVWCNNYKISMNIPIEDELKIGFADNSFDMKNHDNIDKKFNNYLPAIWRKNQIISIPLLDKRKKRIASCIPVKIKDYDEFKSLSN